MICKQTFIRAPLHHRWIDVHTRKGRVVVINLFDDIYFFSQIRIRYFVSGYNILLIPVYLCVVECSDEPSVE